MNESDREINFMELKIISGDKIQSSIRFIMIQMNATEVRYYNKKNSLFWSKNVVQTFG